MANTTRPTEEQQQQQQANETKPAPSLYEMLFQTVNTARDLATNKVTETVAYAKEVAPAPVVQYAELAVNKATTVRDQTLKQVQQTRELFGGHATATRDFATTKATATRDFATTKVSETVDLTRRTASSAYNYTWDSATKIAAGTRSTAQAYLPTTVYSTLENTVNYAVDTAARTATVAKSTAATTYERALSTQEQTREVVYNTATSAGSTIKSYGSLAASYGESAKQRSLDTVNTLLKRSPTAAQ